MNVNPSESETEIKWGREGGGGRQAEDDVDKTKMT